MERQLYKKIIFDETNENKQPYCNDITLEYYKIKNNGKFGVEIRKEHKEKFLINLEKSMIENLKDKENEVEELLNKLIEFKVTPISLEYIIEDFRYTRNI